MIEIKNITKSYDEVLSLCDVSATIGSGSIYGLIGSNGAGKAPCCALWQAYSSRTAARYSLTADPFSKQRS